MIGPAPLTLVVQADRNLGWTGGRSSRFVVATISAAAAASSDTPDEPNNIAAVFDASSDTARLQGAQILTRVLPRLRALDRLAVISAGAEGTIELPSTPMDKEGRARVTEALEGLPRSSALALADGWFAGAQALAPHTRPGVHNRILVFASGWVTHGPSTPTEIARFSAGLASRGVGTTAIGLGGPVDYALLAAMDSDSARSPLVRYADSLDEMAQVIVTRDLRVVPAVVEDAELEVTLPDGFMVSLAGDELGFGTNPARIRLGTLRAGETVRVVFRISLPSTNQTEVALPPVRFRLCAHETVSRAPVMANGQVVFTLVPGARNEGQMIFPETARIAASAWLSRVVHQAIAAATAGDRPALDRLQRTQFRYFRPYVDRLSTGPLLIEQFSAVFEAIRSRWRQQPSASGTSVRL